MWISHALHENSIDHLHDGSVLVDGEGVGLIRGLLLGIGEFEGLDVLDGASQHGVRLIDQPFDVVLGTDEQADALAMVGELLDGVGVERLRRSDEDAVVILVDEKRHDAVGPGQRFADPIDRLDLGLLVTKVGQRNLEL